MNDMSVRTSTSFYIPKGPVESDAADSTNSSTDSSISLKGMEALRDDLVKSASKKGGSDSAPKLELREPASPAEKQATLQFFEENATKIIGAMASLGSFATAQFTQMMNSATERNIFAAVAGALPAVVNSGLGILYAILNPQSSSGGGKTDTYSASANQLSAAANQLSKTGSKIADKEIAAIVMGLAQGAERAGLGVIGIAAAATREPMDVAEILKSMAGVADGVLGMVSAVTVDEKNSAAISAARQEIETVAQQIVAAANGEPVDVASVLAQLGTVVADISAIITATTDEKVAAMVSGVLKPVSGTLGVISQGIMLKTNSADIMNAELKKSIAETRDLTLEQQAKSTAVRAEAAKNEQNALIEKATLEMATSIAGTVASTGAAVAGTAMSVKANSNATTAAKGKQAELGPLTENKADLTAKIKSDTAALKKDDLNLKTDKQKAMNESSRTEVESRIESNRAEIARIDAETAEIELNFTARTNQINASDKHGMAVTEMGKLAGATTTAGAGVAAADKGAEASESALQRSLAESGEEQARGMTKVLDELSESFTRLVKEIKDSAISLMSSIVRGG